MIVKRHSKNRLRNAIFGVLFAIMSLFSLTALTPVNNVYAEPTTTTTTTEKTDEKKKGVSCEQSLGALGWLVCPTTGKISEAVDWLYDKIEDILIINPVELKDGAPIYEIWKYMRGLTNILFIIFFMVVVYSQITGFGISNYGIKKVLPKIIVTAILVNLSFIICQIAVDVSNIVGSSLRGLFTSIETSTMGTMEAGAISGVSMAEMYGALAGGTALAIGATVISIETGAIWMLIPVVLGAIVAVVSGLITIALRQAVVSLLIMISPLAFVAYMLPNTEEYFTKWKKLFTKMLVFYPLFSLLFGASNLAGWAIITSAKDAFGLFLGVAIQIFPLFFSWSLMKMSGTFLSTVNSKIRGLASSPLAATRGWAGSHRDLTKQKYLASNRAYTPSLKLMQFMSNRKVSRDEAIRAHAATVRNRGLAYAANKHYRKDGTPSKAGEDAYAEQEQNLRYQKDILHHENNMNKGFGYLAKEGTAQRARLDKLDAATVKASDSLKIEASRGEKIAYENAMGFHKRMEGAINAHMDDVNGFTTDANGNRVYKQGYKGNFATEQDYRNALDRYNNALNIMEGNVSDVQFAAANAALAYDTQRKVVENKMQKYFELNPPTISNVNRLAEMTKSPDAINNIDMILPGLRILNQRGDTDLVREQLVNILNQGVDLGSHASQALASFLMFEVKDADPWMRRFGKYINLETARVYNKNERQEMKVTYDEYVKGYHVEPDGKIMYAKKGMRELMEGTPLDNIERTALDNYDKSIREAYTDADGKLDFKAYLTKKEEIDKSFEPSFISASLKFLSGSEQLVSAVKAKTGYAPKQKDDGTYEMLPVWETDKDFAGHEEELKAYYEKKTLSYITDQTPTQILGLRSDYRDALVEHLASAYEKDSTEGWTEEQKAEKRACERELAELQTKYGDLSTEEARKNYEAESKKIKMRMAGAKFRSLLDGKGKLNQIYRTRRSGAANNAKDWVRELLDLDNEVAINVKLENDKLREKREFEEAKRRMKAEHPESDTPTEEDDDAGRVYNEVDRASFVSHVEDLWHDNRDDDDTFFKESYEYIKNTLGADSFIATQYAKFHEDDPYADSHAMKEYLTDLLNDPDNY
ncbi:hypothetical protein IJS18_01435 [Candidatus Saccharibacteria bacterium]|nr:hypothetical protein [Candidatus Saccharibacteria bacterium]